MRKTVETRSLLSNTLKDTSTIMRNPMLEYVTHDCDSIAKKTSCSHCFYILARICSCEHAQMYGDAPCHHVLSAVNVLVARRIQCSVATLLVVRNLR